MFDVVVLNPGFALMVKIFRSAVQPPGLFIMTKFKRLEVNVVPKFSCIRILLFVKLDLWSDVVGGLGFPPKT